MSELPPPQEAHWPDGAIFTLGHSTLPIASFVALLQAYGIERLVDIRSIPRSRRNPQFNDTALAESLKAQHFEYVHLRALIAHPSRDRAVFAPDPHLCTTPRWPRAVAEQAVV
jgi:hypothetical protein